MTKTSSFPSSFTSKTTPSRPSQLRQTNARGLLQLLQEHNPCSKADLVRYSGLSAPTVSSGIELFALMDGRVDLVLDGGTCTGGGPTTVDITEPYWRVIKEGAITEREIAERLQTN